MRPLAAPPPYVVSKEGMLQSGSFRGSLPHVDLAPLKMGRLYRMLHHKRWVYLAIATDELFVGLAVVDLGYVKNSFAFVYENGRMVVDRSAIGHPLVGEVGNGIGPGFYARFKTSTVHVDVRRPGGSLVIEAHHPGLDLRAELDGDSKHPALSAIGPVPNGIVDATEKQALLRVRGELRVEGRTRSLDGARGGWDYTHGYLARHTQWRWGYLLGRARGDVPIAMNFVEGFLGENECGVWVGDELHPVGEGRFEFDPREPLAPWKVRSVDGAVDLRFLPGGMHAESNDFRIVRSKFVQPVGRYEGTIRVGGRTYEIDRALGVAEDQDVLW
ncbi:MAG: DUF2804 domain-containing protein [Polyangiales bacterium]